MSKVDAPAVEPTSASLPKRPDPALHRRYMDFSPVRKPVIDSTKASRSSMSASARVANLTNAKSAPVRPVSAPARRLVDLRPASAPTEPEVDSRSFVDGMPVARKKVIKPVSTVPLVEPEIEEEETGPLAEFNELGISETEEELEAEAPLEEAQEDFLAEEDPEDYVETVLSQVSETRTETTVRRSPFLKNFQIEKRPLSDRAPASPERSVTSVSPASAMHIEREEETPAARRFGDRPTARPFGGHHASSPAAPDDAALPVAPKVSKAEKSGSRLGTALTIFITILLGAGVGVFVYLAFFQ